MVKFYENPAVWAELFPAERQNDERPDRYDVANSHFSQFFERA